MNTPLEVEILELVRQACPDEGVSIDLDTAVGRLGLLNSIRMADLLSRLFRAGYPKAVDLPAESYASPRTLAAELTDTPLGQEHRIIAHDDES